MKTVIITLSPRKSFSASLYFSKLLKFFSSKGDVSIVELKTQKQYLEFEKLLGHVDNLVFVTPVYVDTIPSTVLAKLKKIEDYVKDKDISANVYALTNCGFYEGDQCDLALNTFNIWCQRCGFSFKGGLGIGSGVMLSFIRTLIPIGIVLTLFEWLLRGVVGAFSGDLSLYTVFGHPPYTLIIQTALYFLWSMGLFIHTFKMAKSVQSGRTMPLTYTQAWFCPRFLFVIIASIYWLVASMFWYRGAFWRLHKLPKS